MILKREVKDGKINAVYESSNILASTYDKETKDLTITFNKGATYKYPQVDETDYTRFELADSQGVVFNSHIKKYSFEKLVDIDPNTLIAEINTAKAEETEILLKGRQNKIVELMTRLITGSAPVTLYTSTQLEELQNAINNYLLQLKKK